MPACAVNFSNLMNLTGLSFSIEKQWLKVGYRWRASENWIKTSFVSRTFSTIKAKSWGSLDHAILGDPVDEVERGFGWQ